MPKSANSLPAVSREKPTANRKLAKHIAQQALQTVPATYSGDSGADDWLLAALDDAGIEGKLDELKAENDHVPTQNATLINADTLSTWETEQSLQAAMADTVLGLADYLAAVQMVITETFAHSVWVRCEIRSLSSKGGHYYFELADKDDIGNVTASCRGNLWRGQANKLLTKFEKSTGMPLERGLNILIKVTSSFHPQYGFSLTLLDIDPTFTLGDLAQQYQVMLNQLEQQGLLTLNRSLPVPLDIERVLVIAPENAAGLGDFRADADRLAQHGACQFFYQHATFQGNHAPSEIRQAIVDGLKQLNHQGLSPDIVVIIRGGGAVGDLAYLNDYELAALIAELAVPVWVGIGHERDKTLLDEVAHTSFDTPSKVIAAIRQHLVQMTQQAKLAVSQIEQHARAQLQLAKNHTQLQFLQIKNLAQQQLTHARYLTEQQRQYLIQASYAQISHARQQTEQFRAMILLQHPSRVLSQGYAIVRDERQHVVTSIQALSPSQDLTIELQDGEVLATVLAVIPN